MKVALVWPKSTFLIDPMIYPSLGLFYVWEALRQAGVDARFFDLSEDEDWLCSCLDAGVFDQAWVSGTTPQVAELRRLGCLIQGTGVKAVLGGPHAWLKGSEMLPYYDTVVQGEVFTAEAVLPVLYREGLIPLGKGSLEVLPYRGTAWRYHARLRDVPCTTMMTSLGCPYRCAFCSSPKLWGKIRYFPLEIIKEDIRRIARMGFGAVQIYDDILPIRPNRTLLIAEALAESHLLWRCFLRSDLGVRHGLDFLMELHRLGLVEVLVGVESGSQAIKDNIHKGTTVEQDTQLREWCRVVGITYKASVILGLPGETMETMEETRAWLLEHRPDKVDINVLVPMPGTPLYDGDYDCHWTCSVTDEYFFKGKPGALECLVETEALSSQEILAFRNRLVAEIGVPY